MIDHGRKPFFEGFIAQASGISSLPCFLVVDSTLVASHTEPLDVYQRRAMPSIPEWNIPANRENSTTDWPR